MNPLERALVERLKPALAEQGFKHLASTEKFEKKQKFGFLKLSWASYPTAREGDVCQVIEPGLGIRHDRVDDIVNRLGHIWGDANRQNTTTVYRSLARFPFASGGEGRYLIRRSHSESDVEAAFSSVMSMLASDGLAFFERYSSLLECSVGLNEPIEAEVHPLMNNFPLRAYYGVAAAGLAEPGRVSRLVDAYADFAGTLKTPDGSLGYEVAKGLTGVEAVVARLEFVADLATGTA